MKPLICRCVVSTVILILVVSATTTAQNFTAEAYHVRVITTGGNQFRGVLNDVTDGYLYVDVRHSGRRGFAGPIPLTHVQKVVIRRNNKKGAVLTGALLGGVVVGFLAYKPLQKSPPSVPVLYGVVLTSSAVAGAAAGAILGSAFGNLRRFVVRPLNSIDSVAGLKRQLEPFSLRYQYELINHRPTNSQ